MGWFFDLHSQVIDPDRIPYAVAAIILTIVFGMITGPVAGNANPFLWGVFNTVFGLFGDKLDRSGRPRGDLIFRGFLLCAFLLFLAGVAGKYDIASPYVEIVVLSLFLTSGSIWFLLLRLFFAMDTKGGIGGAYYGLSRSSRVDLNSVDDFGIVRTAMGYSAVAFDKGLVAPCLWYLIGGLPLVYVYFVLSFMVWRFGRCGHGSGFVDVPAALEKLMGIIPSLFSGALLTAATAVTPSAKITRVFLMWWKDKDSVPYAQGGMVLSAMALPLQISLGGPVRDIGGARLPNGWVGEKDSTAKVARGHLKRAIFMNVIALLLFVLALLSAYIYAGKLDL